MRKSSQIWGLLTLAVIFLLFRLVFNDRQTPSKSEPVESKRQSGESKSIQKKSIWQYALGYIYTGVNLYYGEGGNKTYIGTILGRNDNYVDPYTGRKFKGIKIQMAGGSVEWKQVEYVWGRYVRTDDPAIKRGILDFYDF